MTIYLDPYLAILPRLDLCEAILHEFDLLDSIQYESN